MTLNTLALVALCATTTSDYKNIFHLPCYTNFPPSRVSTLNTAAGIPKGNKKYPQTFKHPPSPRWLVVQVRNSHHSCRSYPGIGYLIISETHPRYSSVTTQHSWLLPSSSMLINLLIDFTQQASYGGQESRKPIPHLGTTHTSTLVT